MIHHMLIGRTFKRLIYAAFLWTCVCLLVFRLAQTPRNSKNYAYLSLSSTVNGNSLDSDGQRGLLQHNLPPDYGTGFMPFYHLTSPFTLSPSSSSFSQINKPNNNNNNNNNINPIYNDPISLSNSYLNGATKLLSSHHHPNSLPQQSNSVHKQLLQEAKLKLQVDTISSSSSEQDLFNSLSSKSNLPLQFWSKIRSKHKNISTKSNHNNNHNSSNKLANNVDSSASNSCRSEFPSLFDIEYNNVYWQQLLTTNGSFYLYGAYYDDRWRNGPLPSVRILAMIDRIKPPPVNCLLWFDGISGPIEAPATYVYGWYPKWGNYKDKMLQPWIITCKLPRIRGLDGKARSSLLSSSYSSSVNNYAPDSVSIVENRCDKPKNNLKVINNRPQIKEDFAVCVKGLDFLHDDLSVRVIEWIELLKLLGAKKIFLYELEVHNNLSKVLQYYQKSGIVELTPITLPGYQPNLPGFRHLYLKNKLTAKRQNELIPYNDCLYRNLYSYRYLALLDIDEVIMPLIHSNWSQLMDLVERESLKERNYSRASYNVRNVYFLDDLGIGETQMKHTGHESGIPSYLHMLQHVYRSKNYTKPGQYVKCFHNTERVVSLHNHFPLNCIGTCTTYSIDPSLAHLQHYRKDCVGPLKDTCKTDFRIYTTRDTTIWRYKDALIANSNYVLKKLGFLKYDDNDDGRKRYPTN